MSSVMPQPEAAKIVACTVSRDVQNFDLLIEDMENALGENWGDLGFNDAMSFFKQDEAQHLEFIALAMDEMDEDNLDQLGAIISNAKENDIKVILIAEDVTPAALHSLLRQGADEFVPYPLPEGELMQAIERVQAPPASAVAPAAGTGTGFAGGESKEGAVIVMHGLAGGVGSTTMAVNLAWELAITDKKNPPSVCLLDFDLQFGAVATFLDLQRKEVVYEMLSDTESMDEDIFDQALQPYEETLQVLTAPSDMLPLDLLTSEDIQRVLDMARHKFDYVVVDMPSTLVQWSEAVLNTAHIYFTLLELDMRSAQNALRFKRALQSEDLPIQKLRYVLNRAPKFTDMNAKSRAKRMAESLDISIDVHLPEGGKPITQANDHGLPLANSAAKSPLRKELLKLAASIHNLKEDEAEAA